MSLKYLCKHCGYETNRKWSFEDHNSRPSACEKRIKRLQIKCFPQDVNLTVDPTPQDVDPTPQDVNSTVDPTPQNVYLDNKNNFKCEFCDKELCSLWNLKRHIITCKKVDSLQCPACKKTFTSRQGKYKHMKSVKCELVLTEEQQRIKELEEELEEEREKSKEKDKQLEEARTRPTTVYNTTNNIWNNYFNPDIKYNDYDKLSTEHITNEQIHHMYIENRRYFPDVSEAVSRDLFRIVENRCIYVPEGQKGSYGIVYKDGKYIRKPITHIFATVCDTGARHIFESGAIPEKDYGDVNSVNFWNDMGRAIGLHKTDYDDLSQFDKDLITRQKYVGLDVQDEN